MASRLSPSGGLAFSTDDRTGSSIEANSLRFRSTGGVSDEICDHSMAAVETEIDVLAPTAAYALLGGDSSNIAGGTYSTSWSCMVKTK